MIEEQSKPRAQLYSQLLKVPHRDYAQMVAALREAFGGDPDFITHACVHMATGGSKIRDQVDCGIITLLQSPPMYEYRQAGKVLLLGDSVYETDSGEHYAGLPPFRIFRIDRFIQQSDRKVGRQMARVMSDYFGMLELEHNHARADGVVLNQRRQAKSAFKHYYLRGSEYPYVDSLLFNSEPPEGSKLWALRQITDSKNPRQHLRLAKKHNIGYRVLQSLLPDNTASKLVLIEVMTAREALNSRAWMERDGLFNIPEVLAAFEKKLASGDISIASADHRVSSRGTDERVQAIVEAAKDTAAKKSSRIERRTLVMVDISSSMEGAIAHAKEFGSRILSRCDDAMITLFNSTGRVLSADSFSLSDLNRAFLPIRCNGMTNTGAGLRVALNAGFEPEQIVIITDEGDNQGNVGSMTAGMHPPQPRVIVMCIGSGGSLPRKLNDYNVEYERFELTDDSYYIYDQVGELLGGPAATPLAEQIMSVSLPEIVGLAY